jgi:hypothetical protein
VIAIPSDEVEKKYYIDIEFKSDDTAANAQNNVLDGLNSGLVAGDEFPTNCEDALTSSERRAVLINETAVEGIKI